MSLRGSATFRRTSILLPSPAICHLRGAGAGSLGTHKARAGTKARRARVIAERAARRPAGRGQSAAAAEGDLHTDGPSAAGPLQPPPPPRVDRPSRLRSARGFDCSPARERPHSARPE